MVNDGANSHRAPSGWMCVVVHSNLCTPFFPLPADRMRAEFTMWGTSKKAEAAGTADAHYIMYDTARCVNVLPAHLLGLPACSLSL